MKIPIVLFTVLAMACGAEPQSGTDLVLSPDYTTQILGAHDGALYGSIGPANSISTPAGKLEAYDDGSYIAVEVAAQVDATNAVMMLITGSNASRLFVPGQQQHFSMDSYNLDDQPSLNVLGCVGQAIDLYDSYDAAADFVDLSVAAISGTSDVKVSVMGTWLIDQNGETSARLATANFILER